MPKGNIKEVATAVISGVVVVVATIMLVMVFMYGGKPLEEPQLGAYARQKDTLMLALGLLGTVMGYYYGRTPAELRADKAQLSADTAHMQLGNAAVQAATASAQESLATTKASEIMTGVKRTRDQLVSDLKNGVATVGIAPSAGVAAMERARQDLDDLIARWG